MARWGIALLIGGGEGGSDRVFIEACPRGKLDDVAIGFWWVDSERSCRDVERDVATTMYLRAVFLPRVRGARGQSG